jgi:hypothetical protein
MNKGMDEMTSEDNIEGQFKDLLNNPDIPESTKAQVREQIKKSRADAGKARQDFDSKMKTANKTLSKLSSLADGASVEVVKKYHPQLREAMTGFKGEM